MAVIPLLFVAGKSVQVPEEYLILLFKRPLYLRMMWNSLIITIPVLIGQLLLAPLAAYGFWQCRWKYKEILFYLYMIVMLMPLQLTLVPNYLVANWLGIQNSSYQQPLSVYLCQILEEQPDIFYAASVFYAVPVLLIFLMGQDYLIQGISMSGVKA